MAQVWLTRRDGSTVPVEAKAGRALMLSIRKPGEIEAICGGCASCGTCHVYVADDWLGRLPPMRSDEVAVLAFSEWREVNSRLSCQLRMTEELAGLCVTVAPED